MDTLPPEHSGNVPTRQLQQRLLAKEGLNQSILDFQTRNESGTYPDSFPQNQAIACLILSGPSLARIASELIQRLPKSPLFVGA
ncbi:hypothetical protein C7S18_12685 [Ahniella affigens]|uniref:Uncharacterized protein n=1 Tax=Ahniella affigens TaxID=2021234 RepID=A0A2P1PT43_9GAMM|nr:hypothetical protein C7S18_12685 [Ahniella affigens]